MPMCLLVLGLACRKARAIQNVTTAVLVSVTALCVGVCVCCLLIPLGTPATRLLGQIRQARLAVTQNRAGHVSRVGAAYLLGDNSINDCKAAMGESGLRKINRVDVVFPVRIINRAQSQLAVACAKSFPDMALGYFYGVGVPENAGFDYLLKALYHSGRLSHLNAYYKDIRICALQTNQNGAVVVAWECSSNAAIKPQGKTLFVNMDANPTGDKCACWIPARYIDGTSLTAFDRMYLEKSW